MAGVSFIVLFVACLLAAGAAFGMWASRRREAHLSVADQHIAMNPGMNAAVASSASLQAGFSGSSPAMRPPTSTDGSAKGDLTSREGERTATEAMVLRAGLEDALCHLTEVYGEEYLDTFLQRRMRRNVEPFRAKIDHNQEPMVVSTWVAHADDAETALRQVVEAVRKDPLPPT